jgi:hypothetical protein
MRHDLNDPRRSYPNRPVRDDCSAAVLDEAVLSLQLLRAPMLYGDAGNELHALASLRAEIDARIPEVIAEARDQYITWSAIARQLGLTTPETRQRYQGEAPRDR